MFRRIGPGSPLIINYQSYLEKMILIGKNLSGNHSGGYKITKKGVCFGLTMMWTEAVLDGQETLFNDAIKLICSVPAGYLIRKILAAKEIGKAFLSTNKIRRETEHKNENQNTTKEEEKYLNVLALLDGIALYQDPKKNAEFFEKGKVPSQANPENISNLTAPVQLEKQKGLVQFPLKPQMLNKEEVQQYFDDLRQMTQEVHQESKSAEPSEKAEKNKLVIRFGDYNHSIGFYYNITQGCWFACDPGLLPVKPIPHDRIASTVMDFFALKKFLACKPYIYTTGENDLSLIQNKITTFENKHPVTKEMLQRVEHGGITLGLIASLSDHYHKTLAPDYVKATDEHGNNPIHSVVSQTDTEEQYVRECIGHIHNLARSGADLTQKNNAGQTPLAIALQRNLFTVAVIILLKITDGLEANDIDMIKAQKKNLELAFEKLRSDSRLTKTVLDQTTKKENAFGKLLEIKPVFVSQSGCFGESEYVGESKETKTSTVKLNTLRA